MNRVTIIGGASMGWATAYHVTRLAPDIEITVVEKDPSLRYSSTLLSDGNVRIQFNLEENILISKYAMECLENFQRDMTIGDFSPDPAMRRQGNLFLVDESGKEHADSGLATQQRLGCDSLWLEMSEITARFPALETEQLIGGTFGPNDGSVDPSAVVEGYRRASISGDATLAHGTVLRLVTSQGSISAVELEDGTVLESDAVVVCAGAWSPGLLATVGVHLPVDPVMRTVYVVSGAVPEADRLPSFFLPSGVYVLPEADSTFFMAWSTDTDPVGFDFTPAPRSKFYDVIWPELAAVFPAFDRLEVTGSWAGLYAQNRLDANAMVGEWPEIDGLFMATGFSGHGFQQCHAVGRHLAELITKTEPSLDLRRLGPERVRTGTPVLEHAGRII